MLGIKKIISGGQTGVDQGALDFAIAVGIDHGGYCPKGKICETGIIPSKYKLHELSTPTYSERTLKNVLESDGTLLLKDKYPLFEGSIATKQFCIDHSKPILEINIYSDIKLASKIIDEWIIKNNITILNIAGNRESQSPGIQKGTTKFLANISENT